MLKNDSIDWEVIKLSRVSLSVSEAMRFIDFGFEHLESDATLFKFHHLLGAMLCDNYFYRPERFYEDCNAFTLNFRTLKVNNILVAYYDDHFVFELGFYSGYISKIVSRWAKDLDAQIVRLTDAKEYLLDLSKYLTDDVNIDESVLSKDYPAFFY